MINVFTKNCRSLETDLDENDDKYLYDLKDQKMAFMKPSLFSIQAKYRNKHKISHRQRRSDKKGQISNEI